MVSIVLSTYNGEHTLSRMLDSICHLSPKSPNFNIIIVNNGCTDNSVSIIKSFTGRLPITLLEQPVRGKNHALNLALQENLEDLIVFTDDDVIADPDWLIHLKTCADLNADYDIFGGAITPHWELKPEKWLINNIPIGITYASTDIGLQYGDIFPGLIWGPNMMVRKRIFEQGHQFNAAIGPNAGQYIMGSETDFNLRMATLGFKCLFYPAAKVQHIIRDYQVEKEWVLQRAFRFGRNKYYQDRQSEKVVNSEKWLFGHQNYPRWMLRKIIENFILGNLYGLLGNQSKSIRYLWDYYFYSGYREQAQLMLAQDKSLTCQK